MKSILLIITIFIAACIETDIFLPALTDMMTYFSVSEEAIQSLITWNFVGICVSGPFYGPVADAYGRKKPLALALTIFLAGSLVTIFAHNFSWMLAGRLLQGIGSGGCFTLGTAIIFDIFQAEKAIIALNRINTIIPFIMACAPLVGGILNNMFGFRSNFLLIALIVLISLIITLLFFKETLPAEKRAPLHPVKFLADFKKVLTCLPFWQVSLVVSLIFSGYLVFLSITAVLFIVEFGVSKEVFPYYQAAILGGWLIASLTTTPALKKWGSVKLKQTGVVLIIAGGMILAFTGWLMPESPLILTGGMVLYAFGANWIIGLYFPEGMEILPEIKGITASILTSLRLFLTAIVVWFASAVYDGTVYPLIMIEIGIMLFIFPVLWMYEKKKKPAAKVELSSTVVH